MENIERKLANNEILVKIFVGTAIRHEKISTKNGDLGNMEMEVARNREKVGNNHFSG